MQLSCIFSRDQIRATLYLTQCKNNVPNELCDLNQKRNSIFLNILKYSFKLYKIRRDNATDCCLSWWLEDARKIYSNYIITTCKHHYPYQKSIHSWDQWNVAPKCRNNESLPLFESLGRFKVTCFLWFPDPPSAFSASLASVISFTESATSILWRSS